VTATENLARYLVIVACAVSAGVHAGLVPSHLGEDPKLAVAFVLVAAFVFACTIALTRSSPPSRLTVGVAASALAALIAAYAASRTVGLPLAREHTEPLDTLGLVTNAIEAVGLIAALRLYEPAGARLALRKDTR
jgi:drug/metabolite transporter (DMT)-like permease